MSRIYVDSSSWERVKATLDEFAAAGAIQGYSFVKGARGVEVYIHHTEIQTRLVQGGFER